MSKRRELEARRQAEQRRQTMIVLGVIAAVAVLIIGGAIALTTAQSSAPSQPLVVSNEAPPPNAEVNGRAWGPKDAPIQIVEWLDYQCPACGSYAKQYEKAVKDTFSGSNKVRYEIRAMSFLGAESGYATEATLCAAEQNKFWQMHTTIFMNQPSGGAENVSAFSKARLKEMAAKIDGMNTGSLNQCLDSNKYAQQVVDERNAGGAANVRSTPTFVINGKLYPGVRSVEDFRRMFAEVAPTVILGN